MKRERRKWQHVAARLSAPQPEADFIDNPHLHCPTEGKRRYANEVEAHRAAQHQMSTGSPDLRTYLCIFCDSWHLTRG